MKTCKGCKNLVAYGAACKADEALTRVENPMTGAVKYVDLRFPERVAWRPSPEDMRAGSGRCGPDRLLYEPKLYARIAEWFKAIDK